MSWKFILAFSFVFVFSAITAQRAQADTIQYDGLTFTLTNSGVALAGNSTDGYATVSGGTLMICGPDNGSGEPGTTDLVTTAPGTGTVSFDWSFSSVGNNPGDFTAGYLLNGAFTQIADTDGESSMTSFLVTAGETFGFEVNGDNQGLPGTLTISSFSAPSAAAAVPEPANFGLALMGMAGVLRYVIVRRRKVGNRGE